MAVLRNVIVFLNLFSLWCTHKRHSFSVPWTRLPLWLRPCYSWPCLKTDP